MNKIKLEILGLSSSQSQTGSFALVLGEEGRNRRLPIIIGMFEAQSIALEMEKYASVRPMTHDLFKAFAKQFYFDVEEIVISDLRDGVFYAEIVCVDKRDKRRITIDSRPSDAIAIGIRFGVPIYTFEAILQEAGIVLSEIEEEEKEREEETEEKAEKSSPSASSEKTIAEFSTPELQQMLADAIDNEDYEKAAHIRDELAKRGA